MDYGKSATRPPNPKEGDTWTPIDPHPFATGETVVWDGHAWVAQGLMEREAAGLTKLPTPSGTAAPDGGTPGMWSPEAYETKTLAAELGGIGLPGAQETAQSVTDWKWAYEQAAKVAEILEPYEQEVDLEALAQKFYAQRHPEPVTEGEIPPDLFGEGAAGAGVGAAVAPPIFSPEEERLLVDLKNMVELGQLDEDQAWKQLEQYWSKEHYQLGRAEEAGRRGAEELGYWQDIYRSVGPTPTLPRPEGLGFGVPPLEGIPVSQLPQPSQIFGQAQQQMGLPGQLAPIQAPNLQLPNWQALLQNMPTFSPTGNSYIDQLMREGRTTAPAL